MVGLALVAGVLRYGMRELINGLSRRIEYDLRNDLFAHLLRLDAGYFGRTRTGDIMARLTNDLSAVRQAVGPAIMYLINTIAGGVFALYFMLRIDSRLTLLALTPMVLLPILTIWLGRAIHERFEAVQEHFSTMTTRAQENLAGARVVRAYRQEQPELDRFAGLNDEYLAKNMQLVRLYGLMNPAFGLLAGLGAVTVLGVGGTLAVRGTISVGAFVAFGLYLGMLTWPLIALGWVVNLFQRGAASGARLLEILDAVARGQQPAGTHVAASRDDGAVGRIPRRRISLPAARRRATALGASRHLVPRERGRDARRRRRDWQWQECAARAARSRLRSAGRSDPHRRRTGDVAHARRASPRDRVRATGEPPVQRDDPRAT